MVGIYTCHSTGESAVATGAEGADGVCVLIMYCSGAAYLKRGGPKMMRKPYDVSLMDIEP